MDYSTKSTLESNLGIHIDVTDGVQGGYDTCTVQVPWKAFNLGILSRPRPSGSRISKIEAEFGKYGYLLMSQREHRPFGDLLAGSKTILIFQCPHLGR